MSLCSLHAWRELRGSSLPRGEARRKRKDKNDFFSASPFFTKNSALEEKKKKNEWLKRERDRKER
jgi:hypothetical protein